MSSLLAGLSSLLGTQDVPRLDVDDETRREWLHDDLPETCRMCETGAERLRIPGQFLCEVHGLEKWGRDDLTDVLGRVPKQFGGEDSE